MSKGLEFRALGRRGVIIPTPLYVDDQLLAEIVLGENARHWRDIRRVFERQGMPTPRASVYHLHYVPAVLDFLDRREGVTSRAVDYPEDGPDNFGP
jgi:hypothetical protein